MLQRLHKSRQNEAAIVYTCSIINVTASASLIFGFAHVVTGCARAGEVVFAFRRELLVVVVVVVVVGCGLQLALCVSKG